MRLWGIGGCQVRSEFQQPGSRLIDGRPADARACGYADDLGAGLTAADIDQRARRASAP